MYAQLIPLTNYCSLRHLPTVVHIYNYKNIFYYIISMFELYIMKQGPIIVKTQCNAWSLNNLCLVLVYAESYYTINVFPRVIFSQKFASIIFSLVGEL